MQLRYPIEPAQGQSAVRVLVIAKQDQGSFQSRRFRRDSGEEALLYLDVVCPSEVSVVMTCNSLAAATDSHSLEAAQKLIASGAVDVVITTDMSRLSRRGTIVLQFVEHCQQHSVRFISFIDHFDTANSRVLPNLLTFMRYVTPEKVVEEGGAK